MAARKINRPNPRVSARELVDAIKLMIVEKFGHRNLDWACETAFVMANSEIKQALLFAPRKELH
jgi:hypothetical protein